MSTYIIYQTINLVNGKIYIGQHLIQPETSAGDGYLGSGLKIIRAFKKYGKEKFIRETIEFCTSANANEREVYWIDKLDATNPEVGYNIHIGGTGGNMVKWDTDKRKEMSKIKIGLIPWNKGLTIEDKRVFTNVEAASKTKKESQMFVGEKNPMYGRKHTEKSKSQMSMKRKGVSTSNKGLKNGMVKPVIIIDPNGKIFENVCINEWFRNFGKDYNITKSFLRTLAKNKIVDNRGWKCYFNKNNKCRV